MSSDIAYIIFDQYFSDNVEERLGRNKFIGRIFIVFFAFAVSIIIGDIFSYLMVIIFSLSDRILAGILLYLDLIIATIWWFPIIFLVRKRAHDYGSNGIFFTIQVIMIMLTLISCLIMVLVGSGKHGSPDAYFGVVIGFTFIYYLQIIILFIGCLLHAGDKGENMYGPPPKS